jgi:hypothetical protein
MINKKSNALLIATLLILQIKISAQNSNNKNNLFDEITFTPGMQFTQHFSLSSKQTFTSYFSRNVGFRTKYLNFGISRQEYFSPTSADGFDFNQRFLSNGVYAGLIYPITSKLEIGVCYQRSQLKYVHPYTQVDNVDGWFNYTDYRSGYDFGNEITLSSSYKVEDYLYIVANAKFGFNTETFGNNYAGYSLGIAATLPEMNSSFSKIDSISFKKKKSINGFIGTTRILKDDKQYNHRFNASNINNEQSYLTEVVFNYDLYQPVATVCAGVMLRGGNLIYLNFGKHETFTKNRDYTSNKTNDIFINESYLYHSQLQCIGISADINPFSFYKKTSQWHLFPVVSIFAHAQQREQQSIRNVISNFFPSYYQVIEMNMNANVLHYGTALGIGGHLGRFYGNVKFDVFKANQVDMNVKRVSRKFSQTYGSNLISEENLPDLDIKGSVSMKNISSAEGIQNAVFNQSAFTIGILF